MCRVGYGAVSLVEAGSGEVWRGLAGIFFLALLVGVVGCGGGKKDPEPEPPPPAIKLIDKPPRGIAGLHCNQDQARPNCEMIVKALVDSLIDQPAINYLANGTFGFVPSHMMHDINLLTQDGRKPEITFYGSNGPGQRRCENTQDPSWDVRICSDDFRRRIVSEAGLQEKYRENVRRLLPVIDFGRVRGAKIRFVVALEDNLNRRAFDTMYGLARAILPPEIPIGRNPCPGCAGGDSGGGDFTELHPDSPGGVTIQNGIITNDGDGFDFPGDNNPFPRKVPWQQLRDTMIKANELGNVFLLWHQANQGLTTGSLPPPAGRPYKKLEQRHVDFYIQFLRQ